MLLKWLGAYDSQTELPFSQVDGPPSHTLPPLPKLFKNVPYNREFEDVSFPKLSLLLQILS